MSVGGWANLTPRPTSRWYSAATSSASKGCERDAKQIVHAADIESDLHKTQRDPTPGDRCRQAARRSDDHRLLERGQFIYDALYA
jgi:hypothetical protein